MRFSAVVAVTVVIVAAIVDSGAAAPESTPNTRPKHESQNFQRGSYNFNSKVSTSEVNRENKITNNVQITHNNQGTGAYLRPLVSKYLPPPGPMPTGPAPISRYMSPSDYGQSYNEPSLTNDHYNYDDGESVDDSVSSTSNDKDFRDDEHFYYDHDNSEYGNEAYSNNESNINQHSQKDKHVTPEQEALKQRLIELYKKATNSEWQAPPPQQQQVNSDEQRRKYQEQLGRVLHALNPRKLSSKKVKRVLLEDLVDDQSQQLLGNDNEQHQQYDDESGADSYAYGERSGVQKEQQQYPEPSNEELRALQVQAIRSQLDASIEQLPIGDEFSTDFVDDLKNLEEDELSPEENFFRRLVMCRRDPQMCSYANTSPEIDYQPSAPPEPQQYQEYAEPQYEYEETQYEPQPQPPTPSYPQLSYDQTKHWPRHASRPPRPQAPFSHPVPSPAPRASSNYNQRRAPNQLQSRPTVDYQPTPAPVPAPAAQPARFPPPAQAQAQASVRGTGVAQAQAFIQSPSASQAQPRAQSPVPAAAVRPPPAYPAPAKPQAAQPSSAPNQQPKQSLPPRGPTAQSPTTAQPSQAPVTLGTNSLVPPARQQPTQGYAVNQSQNQGPQSKPQPPVSNGYPAAVNNLPSDQTSRLQASSGPNAPQLKPSSIQTSSGPLAPRSTNVPPSQTG